VLKVGLTGGIGCGKTTVADFFTRFSVPIIDADTIARKLVAPGQAALLQIQQIFGTDVFNADGTLNRAGLGKIVFNDSQKKQQLEQIIHPLVYQTIQQEIDKLNVAYCIISIPLLFETKMTHVVDRILVVDCPVETQIERVKKRDNLSEQHILAIINSQVSHAFRNANADDVIDNSNTNDRLAEEIERLHNFYLTLSI
jgi:dephospho-CoA kinase